MLAVRFVQLVSRLGAIAPVAPHSFPKYTHGRPKILGVVPAKIHENCDPGKIPSSLITPPKCRTQFCSNHPTLALALGDSAFGYPGGYPGGPPGGYPGGGYPGGGYPGYPPGYPAPGGYPGPGGYPRGPGADAGQRIQKMRPQSPSMAGAYHVRTLVHVLKPHRRCFKASLLPLDRPLLVAAWQSLKSSEINVNTV
jgi:hypothetical protein